MITDRIGRHEFLLPINHDYNKICDFLGFFESEHKKFWEFFAGSERKKSHLRACTWSGAYCPIPYTLAWRVLSYYSALLVLKSGRWIVNQIWEFCYSYD